MNQRFKKSVLALGVMVSPLIMATNIHAQTFEEALAETKPMFNILLRYEGVEQDNALEDAEALTYRIRAGLETGAYKDTKFLIDFDYTEAVSDEYAPESTGYSVVPDPEVVELNRLQLTNSSITDTTITIGRQRIIHPGARYVGNVGWRQDEQTYDAIRVQNKSIPGFAIDASYVARINRIFGDGEATAAGTSPEWESDSWLLRGSGTFDVGGAKIGFSPFTYILDLQNQALSSKTYGMDATLKQGMFSAKASYAIQEDHAQNPFDFKAPYYIIEAGLAKSGFTGAIGYEVLGSDDGIRAFTTPLATLHAYNGWADQFLVTPNNGLQDAYAKIGYKTSSGFGPFDPFSFLAFYHDFSADEGSADYGSEIDLVASTKIGKTGLLVKYADYSADSHNVDAQKVWVQASYSF